ncbi:unnamed protein product [Rotaria sordida]|uniref:F-box domain-containing protein n=1 Tax=Rotaria sordida TaxID=392033 RepID=A0A814MC90_9BILA|nr:unnamed protein product [Rotaria sordida]CAF1046119.1 unnamed protein product [Rotaria sordida]CAF1076973.1 unnamed protein product [Rotaria sordida]CAF3956221.1 unnamed protein product [Rotaria sordida]CAF3990261.1 unnamed protein product [Rotaria sordida]
MPNLLLDCLPVEIFYEILSYLSGGHILKAFHSLNNHFNNILIGYDHYILDLSASDISKKEFDLICSFLRSEQIVGLQFGRNYFDLVNRFISNFSNRQSLNRLRSLWIDDTILIDQLFLTRLVSIIDLNKLVSIRFDRIYLNHFNTSSRYTFDSLKHLVLCSSRQFRLLSKQIPTHLTFLHIFSDSINVMDQFIRSNMRQLKSLGIGLHCDSNNIQQFTKAFSNYQWTHLIQFNLRLNGKYIKITLSFQE